MNKLLLLVVTFIISAGVSSQEMVLSKAEVVNTIAILPLHVITEDRKVKKNAAILRQFREQDRKDGIVMQRDLYRYFLRDLFKKEYPSSYIQDVNETNRILREAGIEHEDVFKIPPTELANLLRVEGIMMGEIDHRVPTKGLLVSLASGGWPGSNRIKSVFRLHSMEGKLVWGREIKLSGADEDGQIYGVCKKILRKIPDLFPYHRMEKRR